jgi:SAM-dependent methyltransferase
MSVDATLTLPARGPSAAVLRSVCGRSFPLLVDRWWASPAPEEESVLDLALPAVLDLGCGPGRHTRALLARGVRALGVDSAEPVVSAARSLGAPVVHRSIFDPLPEEGRWATALLLDGNVGIGGDPERLFARVRQLLRSGGRALVEVEEPGQPTERLRVRAERPGGATGWFDWARLGADGLDGLASSSGFDLIRTWERSGRWFARLDAR